MRIKAYPYIFFLTCFFLICYSTSGQTRKTRNNYTGNYENPSSWDPSWASPSGNIYSGFTINGKITRTGNLSVSNSGKLTIKDTLIIYGDLYLGEENELHIENNSILIVFGNLHLDEESEVKADAYFIVTGNILRSGDDDEGEFKSNDNPVKVFIGGSVPSNLTNNNSRYSALNCSRHPTIPYTNSTCSYGNMLDLLDDPMYSFYKTLCPPTVPATILANGATSFCAGGNVILTASAGIAYIWSTTATTSSINVNSTGSYTVRVTNAIGCQSTVSAATTVTVNALPPTPTITAGGPTSFCPGGSVKLTSSAGSTYLWSTGANTSSITVSSAGTYTVRVTNASGCQSAVSAATIVTVNALPATPTITAGGPTTFCNGGSVALTSSAGSTYAWSTGATTASIIVNAPGNYTVRVTNANGCQSASSSATVVKVNLLPVVNAGIDATIAYGTSATLNATVSGTGPFTYSWTPASNLVNALIEDPTTVNLTETTIFTLTAASTATSCSNTDAVIISISGGPLTSGSTASPGTICAGEPIQLNALAGGGSGSYTYTWTSVPARFTSSVANPTDNPTVNTTYRLNVNDGFTNVNSQVSVTVNALPAIPTITAGGPTNFCVGGNVTLTSSTATKYLWSTGATTPGINVTAAGSYTVQVTNPSGCQSAASVATVITVNALPSPPTIIPDGPTTFCYGGSVALTSSIGITYLWSTGAVTPNINVKDAGKYTVQITDVNGCRSTVSAMTEVTENDLPVATAGNNGPVFSLRPLNLTGGPEAMTSYLWKGPVGFTSNSQSPSVSARALAPMAGEYTLTVTDARGCSNSVTTTVEEIKVLIPSVITPNGDGQNDCFVIVGNIDQVELTIINRWGNIEYTNGNYLNDWDGRNNKQAELPNETYFYILRFEDGNILKGSVLIKR